MKLPAGYRISAVVSRDKEAPVSLANPKLWIDGDRSYISATDGVMGLVVDVVTDAEDIAGILPLEAVEAAEKGVTEEAGAPLITAGADVIVHLLEPKRTLISERPADLAPDIRRTIERVRKKKIVARVALNAELLHKLAKGLGTKNVLLTLRDDGGIEAVEVSHPDEETAKSSMAILAPRKREP